MRPYRYLLSLPLLAILIFGLPATAISDDNKEQLCPVHHVPLRKERLGITYGLVVDPCFSFDRIKAEEKYFPYANSVIYGGCLIYPDSPKDEEVLYCPKCREVEKSWPCLETNETPIITTLPPPRATKLQTHR
jgi:hypothetical protein